MAPDGSTLLTLDALSVQTNLEEYRRIVWMIKWVIKAHPTQERMPRRATARRIPDGGSHTDVRPSVRVAPQDGHPTSGSAHGTSHRHRRPVLPGPRPRRTGPLVRRPPRHRPGAGDRRGAAL